MVKIIAEIGINHNGSIEECKKMIMLAKVSGCDYAKIQKRNPVMHGKQITIGPQVKTLCND